ncbi:unnamed protein product [Urochloa humidicola]
MAMASASLVRNGRRRLNDAHPAVVVSNDGVLPADALYEVLLRLPADALCRLRLVCYFKRSVDCCLVTRGTGPRNL